MLAGAPAMIRDANVLAGRRPAFTMVELMVVIVIIGVLVAILLPALGAVHQYALNIQCQSNLRQIATSVLSYTADYRGAIPPTYDENSGLYWCNLLAVRDLTAQKITRDNEPKSVQDSVFMCPASTDERVRLNDTFSNPDDPKAQGWYRLGNNEFMTDCTYYWNGYTGSNTEYLQRFPSLKVPKNAPNRSEYYHDISEVKQRSMLAMVMDGVFYDGHERPQRIAARHAGAAGNRRRTNIAFYDAHVEAFDREPDRDAGWSKEKNSDPESSLVPIMPRTNLEVDSDKAPAFMMPKR